MKRFENAQVGDRVYCRKYGFGKIRDINIEDGWYPVEVAFDNGEWATYTHDGYLYIDDVKPMLFYSDGINKYLTERPESIIETEINWAEWEGKEIEVSFDKLDNSW